MSDFTPETLVTHLGREPTAHHGIVNPPVYHASTVLFPTVAALEEADRHPYDGVYYGRYGTPTTFALEDAVATLEGGHRAITTASGLAAITTALLAFTRAGDHILVSDSVYFPTRRFCAETLSHYGIETEYYNPTLGAGIARLIRPNTTVVFTESPGSHTFEMQDIPALAAAAKRAAGPGPRLTVIMDNTWATPIGFKPFAHGVDVSVHAGTKYIVGHSDAMLGLIVCQKESYDAVKTAAARLGTCAGPDDVYLALRGLRTLAVRLQRHAETGIALAEWLAGRPEVARVLHPALPGDPGHAIWKRDFTAACGLFGFTLKPCSKAAVAAMVDHMKLFRLGYSWGGFESHILPCHPAKARTATRWTEPGPLLRIHAGLENVHDLIADLEQGLARLKDAA